MMSIRDQQAFANSSGNGAIVNSGKAQNPVPAATVNPTQADYNAAQQKALQGKADADRAQQDRSNWAAQQMTEAQQTGAGASGGRNNSAWQDQARYGYTDPNAVAKQRYTSGPTSGSEGAVDWSMMGTGGGYEEKERRDAAAAMSAWGNDNTYNRQALAQYNSRDVGQLQQNTGDVRESWRNFQDLDTGTTEQQNVRRGMGGTPVYYGSKDGMTGSIYGTNLAAATNFKPQANFGGGGMAAPRGGTYDGVPTQQQNTYGQTASIRWQ